MDERNLDEATRAVVAQVVRDQIEATHALLDAAKNGSWGELVVAYDEAIEILRQRKQEAYDKFNAQCASRRPVSMHPSAPPISLRLPPPPLIPSVAARQAKRDIPTEMLPNVLKGRPPRRAPKTKMKRKR